MNRIVLVKYTGNAEKKLPSKGVYRMLLKAGLTSLAEGNDYKKHLRKLFPNKGVIGIKTNCLARLNPTPKQLAQALCDILIDATGIGENDIVVWERTNRELKEAGYGLNASSFGRRCLGTDSAGVGYDRQFFTSGKVSTLVTRILTRMVNHNINLPVLKDHSIAGMSGALKNMFGAIHNPNKYHPNNCDPFVADVSNLEPIRSKHRLTIIDAVRVQYDKGPGFDPRYIYFYNGLIISDDPVAADSVGLEILEHLRKTKGRPSLADAGKPVKYLKSAQAVGLGTADMKKIELQVVGVDAGGRESRGAIF